MSSSKKAIPPFETQMELEDSVPRETSQTQAGKRSVIPLVWSL